MDTTATERTRFSLMAWAKEQGYEPRHVKALTGLDAEALGAAARAWENAKRRVDDAVADEASAKAAIVPFISKLEDIRKAAG